MTAYGQAPTGKLIITFTNIRSDVGIIALGLYDKDAKWTDEPLCTYHWNKEEMRNACLTVEIDSLPRKRYACAVLDDEDRSLSMRYFIGLPREGWGMSANPSFFKLKKPGFEDVAFDLDCPVLRMDIKLNYLNKNKNVE